MVYSLSGLLIWQVINSGSSLPITYCFLFFIIPANRQSQPAMKVKPPSGVMAPIQSYPGNTAALIKVSAYKEMQNKIIPTTKSLPDHIINLFGNSLYKIPDANNANA